MDRRAEGDVTGILSTLLDVTTASVQEAVLALLPHGGQGRARRNARRAMAEDAATARERYEAERALSSGAWHGTERTTRRSSS